MGEGREPSPAQAESVDEPAALPEGAARVLAELRQRTSVIGSLSREVADRLGSLERDLQRSRDLEERLGALMRDTPSAEQMAALDGLLQTWSQRPSDLMVMVRLSEEAERLAGIVRAFTRIQSSLDESSVNASVTVTE
jgi:predicted nuclease with TOPRIM domain